MSESIPPWPRSTVFGSVMREWESIWPYNAAQTMVLTTPMSLSRVQASLDTALESVGIAWLGASPVVSAIDPVSHIAQQMNKPFAPHDPPLRPFACGSHVGLVYRHWPLDSVSVRLLMRRWFESLHDLPPDAPPLFELHEPPMPVWRSLFKHPGRLIDEYKQARLQKQVRRLAPSPARSHDVGFIVLAQPAQPVDVGPMLRAVRDRGLSLNDLFLAAAAIICHRLFAPDSPSRTWLTIGTIVDARSIDDRDLVGLKLAFDRTAFPPESLGSIDATLTHLALKPRDKPTLAHSNWRLASMLRWTRNDTPEQRLEFYRKRVAASGGISNVNLDRDWPAIHFPDRLRGYFRTSPLGPALPLVFAPTTLGQSVNVTMTYRRDLLDPAQAASTLEEFLRLIQSLS